MFTLTYLVYFGDGNACQQHRDTRPGTYEEVREEADYIKQHLGEKVTCIKIHRLS